MAAPSTRSLPVLALALGIAALIALLVVPLPGDPLAGLPLALRDACHFPVFLLLTLAIDRLLLRVAKASWPRALLLATIFSILIAGGTEWLQTSSTRTASWRDLGFNAVGVVVAAITLTTIRTRRLRSFKFALGATIGAWLVAIGLVTAPIRASLAAGSRQAAALPVLGDFEAPWERAVWSVQGEGGDEPTSMQFSDTHSTHGNHSLRIEAHGASWAGGRLRLAHPVAWPESGSLSFDVINPEHPFTLGIRVDGIDGDRYSSEARIPTGTSRWRLSSGDFRHRDKILSDHPSFTMEELVFHLGPAPARLVFHLDHVRLE